MWLPKCVKLALLLVFVGQASHTAQACDQAFRVQLMGDIKTFINEDFKSGIITEMKRMLKRELRSFDGCHQVAEQLTEKIQTLELNVTSDITNQIQSTKDQLSKVSAELMKKIQCAEDRGSTDLEGDPQSFESNGSGDLPEHANCTSSSPYGQDWHTVGSDRFVRFSTQVTWDEARELCSSHCLELYRPTDVLAVAQYLEDNFSEQRYWLGGRGTGTHQAWLDGEPVSRDEPWWHSSEFDDVGQDQCLEVLTCCGKPGRGTVLDTDPCSWINSVLCG